MAEIFLSYKTEDRPRVARLVEALRAGGLDVWWDQDIPPGGSWRETIAAELDAASLCIVAWSAASTGPSGRYVREEAERAARRGAYLGVLIDPVEPPFGFGEWQSISLAGWNGRASAPEAVRFVEQVRARLQGKPAPPTVAVPVGRKARRLALVSLAGVGLVAAALWIAWRAWPSAAATASPSAFVNERIAAADCAWLQISSVSPAGDAGERIALAGIAAAPEALQASMMRGAIERQVPLAEIEVADVAISPPETCAELELLRRYRWEGRSRLTVIPPRGDLRRTEHGWSGRFEFEADYARLPPHAALLGLDSVGGVEVLVPDLHAFRREHPPLRANGSTAAYEGYFFDDNRGARNVGLILMTATGEIDPVLVASIGERADRAFLDRLDRAAQAQGWEFELALVRCGFAEDAGRGC